MFKPLIIIALVGSIPFSHALDCWVSTNEEISLKRGFGFCEITWRSDNTFVYRGYTGNFEQLGNRQTGLVQDYCYVEMKGDVMEIFCICNVDACNTPMNRARFSGVVFNNPIQRFLAT